MKSFKLETEKGPVALNLHSDLLDHVKFLHPRSLLIWTQTGITRMFDGIPVFNIPYTLSGLGAGIDITRSQFLILYQMFKIKEILLHYDSDKNCYQFIVKTWTTEHIFDLIEVQAPDYQKELEGLKEQIAKLEQKFLDYEYQPPIKCTHCGIGEIGGGPEYFKAKEHFDSL